MDITFFNKNIEKVGVWKSQPDKRYNLALCFSAHDHITWYDIPKPIAESIKKHYKL